MTIKSEGGGGRRVRPLREEFLLRLALLGCGEKNILPNLTNSQEPEPFFFPLGAGAARKKYQEPVPLGKKNQEPERLEKKVRSRSR